MLWTLADIAEATHGTVEGGAGSSTTEVSSFTIDSRNLAAGQMFVAVRDRRDGHEFVPAAFAAGAAAALVDRRLPDLTGPVVRVLDTRDALLALGAAARRRLDIPIVAITGSVGKTSTKDLAAAALGSQRRVLATPRSWNNELGVPLTLAGAPDGVEVGVVEMGARGAGHIALLCRLARPTIGVVTAVAHAHTEMFHDIEGVAAAKGELVEALPATGGTAVLNGDDPLVRLMAVRSKAPVVYYGIGSSDDVIADGVEVDDDLRPSFRIRSPWGTAQVKLEARGVHQVGNALAALTVACLVGVDLYSAVASIGHAGLSPMRMDLRRAANGLAVLDDSYNANPASVAAALQGLAVLGTGRRVAVLGYMAELGERSEDEHRAVLRLARDLGVEVIAVGTAEYGVDPVDDLDGLADRLLSTLGPGDAVLVKGSRVAGMERLADRLLAS